MKNQAANRQTPADKIAARFIAALEKGVAPWRCTWSAKPAQGITGHVYSGINRFLLALHNAARFECPFFLTFHRALELGGNVKKGEHGCPILYAKTYTRAEEVTNENGETEMRITPRRVFTGYTVFNLEQCEGISKDALPKAAREESTRPALVMPDEIRAAGEAVWNGYKDAPTRLPERGSEAFYRPDTDEIQMPRMETFESGEAYYSTLFHEMIHSTGAKKRLDRQIRNTFGSYTYGREELIAEMGAAIIGQHTGIAPKVFDNSAAYFASWIKTIQEDPGILLAAAGAAQKAADYILGTKQEAEEGED
jgi:antirestriction protein ArdC